MTNVVAEMSDLAEQGLIPPEGNGDGLSITLESLPELFDRLKTGVNDLAEWTGEQSPALGVTGGFVADMVVHLGACEEAARQAFLEFQQVASFWRGG